MFRTDWPYCHRQSASGITVVGQRSGVLVCVFDLVFVVPAEVFVFLVFRPRDVTFDTTYGVGLVLPADGTRVSSIFVPLVGDDLFEIEWVPV